MTSHWQGSDGWLLLIAGRSTGLKAASYSTKLNANTASAQRSKAQSAATLTAALEYRRQQQALADTAAVSASAAKAGARADSARADAVPAESSNSSPSDAAGNEGRSRLLLRRLHQNGARDAVQQPQRTAAFSNGAQQEGAAAQGAQHAQRAQHGKSSLNGAQQPDATVSSNGNGNGAVPGLDQERGPGIEQSPARSPPWASNGASTTTIDSSTSATSSGVDRNGSEAAAQANGLHSIQNQNGTASQLQDSLPAQPEASVRNAQNGVTSNTEGPVQEATQDGKSSEAGDAMAAALASIRAQKPPGKSPVSGGPRAIPNPTPNTSPRIKNALLAAQEYRKQKAAKTAALAVAAAKAAAEAAKATDSNA